MEITSVKEGEVVVFTLSGRLDAQTAPGAERVFKGWVEAGETKLAGDLGQLGYISSAGLRVILMTAKNLKPKSGQICLFGLQKSVQEVFDMAGFSAFIPIVGTREEALEKVG